MRETHTVSAECFKYRMRDYLHCTLTDTIADQYVYADDFESLALVMNCTTPAATMGDRKISAVYCHPLWEIFDFADFKNEVTIQLAIDTEFSDSDVDHILLTMPFDFSQITFRASADAQLFMRTLAAFLASQGVTVHPHLFDRHVS